MKWTLTKRGWRRRRAGEWYPDDVIDISFEGGAWTFRTFDGRPYRFKGLDGPNGAKRWAAEAVDFLRRLGRAEEQSWRTDETRPRTVWDLAAEAQAEVDQWPAWKRRAADEALVASDPLPPKRKG